MENFDLVLNTTREKGMVLLVEEEGVDDQTGNGSRDQ